MEQDTGWYLLTANVTVLRHSDYRTRVVSPEGQSPGCARAHHFGGPNQAYLTEGVFKVVLQKSILAQIINLSFVITKIKNKVTNLCGN